MKQSGSYRFERQLFVSANCEVWLGHFGRGSRIMKVFNRDMITDSDLARLEHEYAVLMILKGTPGVAQVLERTQMEGRQAFAFKAQGLNSLESLVKGALSVAEFLSFALKLCPIIDAIHDH